MRRMAKRQIIKRNSPSNEVEYHCEDCSYAYGLHERSVKGEMFMYHCAKNEPFSVIKTWKSCNKFKLRENESRSKEAV